MVAEFKNVSNPATFGVEWTAGDNGSTFQLVNVRGQMTLMFGIKTAGAREWSAVPVVDPSRFMTSAPKTFAEFREIATAYVTA